MAVRAQQGDSAWIMGACPRELGVDVLILDDGGAANDAAKPAALPNRAFDIRRYGAAKAVLIVAAHGT